MNFDSFTIIAMMFILLLTLIGMSRSVLLYVHNTLLVNLLNEPYEDMRSSTKTPILFSNAWGVISRTLKNEDENIYTSVDDVLEAVRLDIDKDIKQAHKNPLTLHLIPLMNEAQTQLELYRDHISVKLKQTPMFDDNYSRNYILQRIKY